MAQYKYVYYHYYYYYYKYTAFSALTLLVGRQEEHWPRTNSVMRCWCKCSYVSAVRCRLFAYGPADPNAIPKPHHLLPHLNPDWFYLSVSPYPGCPGKEAVKRVVEVVVMNN